jgi:preprotein translocase subunit SecE
MAKGTATATTAKKGFSIRRFFGDITAELKKVVWLSRRETAYLTGVVIVVTVIAGVILGFLDMGFTNLVNNVLLGG